MLTDKEIDALLSVFQNRMQNITDEYLQKMGEHINKIGTLYPADVNRLIEMNRVNKNMSDVQKKIAAYSNQSTADIAKIFAVVAKSDKRFLEKYFGKKATAANMRSVIEAQLKVTQGAMKNLSQTTIDATSYRKAVDAAVNAVQSGVDDYHSAVRRSLRNAGLNGLQAQYPSGYRRRVDTAVRQNVLDGVRAVNQQILYGIGEEFGANGVEISAHMLCAEDHLPYQGRQYSFKEFSEIQGNLDRKFGMWNCRHTMYPIILGVSQPAYSDQNLRDYERNSNNKIEINGDTMTRYEWSQEMRRIETAIRWQQDILTAATAAKDDKLMKEAKDKIKNLKKYYEKVSDATKIKRDFTRVHT